MSRNRQKTCGDLGGANRIDPAPASQVFGRLISPGERVKVIHSNRPQYLGQWGTVERNLGLGKLRVLLDTGDRTKFEIRYLWFEKEHRDP